MKERCMFAFIHHIKHIVADMDTVLLSRLPTLLACLLRDGPRKDAAVGQPNPNNAGKPNACRNSPEPCVACQMEAKEQALLGAAEQ